MTKIKSSNIFGDVIVMNLGSLLTRIFQFVFIILISRNFGKELFGYYGTANTASIFLMTFFSFGSGFYLTREVAFDKNKTSELFNGIVKIRLFLLVIGGVIFLPLISYFPYPRELKLMLYIFFFIGAVKGIIQQFNQLYQAYKYFRVQLFFDALIYFGLMLIGIFFFLSNYGILEFSYVLLIFYSSCMLLEAFYIQFRIVKFRFFNWDIGKLVGIFKNALPFLFASLIGVIYYRIDIFMLGFFQSQSEVGLYVAPYNMYEAFLFIPVAFGTAIFPHIVPHLRRKQYEYLEKQLSNLIYPLLIIMIPITVLLMVFSFDLVELIFGPEYQRGAYALILISGGLIFHSFNNIFGRILYSINQERYQLKISAIAMLVNIVLNLILIPRYSIIGAAVSTIISFCISFLLHLRKVKIEIGLKRIFSRVHLIKLLIFCFLLTLASIAVSHISDRAVIINLIVIGLFYCIMVYSIDRDLRVSLKKFLTKASSK
jgi:O-antigen/teichoic acid export membrane protein